MPPRKLKPQAPLPERIAALEASLRMAWNRWRALIFGMFLLWLLSVVIAAFLGRGLSHTTDRTATAQATADGALASLRTFEVGACHRGNVQRASDNRSRYDDFLFEKSVIHLLAPALAHPAPSNLPPAQRIAETRFADKLLAAAKQSAANRQWGHLIEDCEQAVEHPGTYRFPPLVSFTHELPPYGALHVGPGE